MISDEYISKSDLLKREGWTSAFIKKLEIQPEIIGKFKFYSKKQILEIEKKETFKKWKSQHKLRSLISFKTFVKRKEKLLKTIKDFEIRVDFTTDLKTKALNHLFSHLLESKNYVNISSKHIEKIIVNFIRHRLTNYQECLALIKNKPGNKEAYLLINQLFYNKIIEQYGSFKMECLKQLYNKTLPYLK